MLVGNRDSCISNYETQSYWQKKKKKDGNIDFETLIYTVVVDGLGWQCRCHEEA